MVSAIKISQKGDFSKTFKFLQRAKQKKFIEKLSYYGQMGVEALSQATPVRSGKTASSWSYFLWLSKHNNKIKIVWTNDNQNKYANVAVLLQYGHATRNGGYVQGIDYINPAMRPVFEKIAQDAWLEVISDE